MKKTSVLSASALLAASGLLLTACGSEPKLADAWPEMHQSIDEAESVRMVFDAQKTEGSSDGEGDGQEADSSASASAAGDFESANFDIAGATDDSFLAGTLSTDMGAGSMDMEILKLEDEFFMKFKSGGEDAPQGMDMITELVGDRWMQVPASQMGSSADDMSMNTMLDSLKEEMPAADAFEGEDITAEKVDIDGKKYDKYTLPEDKGGKDFAGVVILDPEDNSLYRLESFDSAQQDVEGTATFTEWNEVQKPERPADDEILDMEDLANLAG